MSAIGFASTDGMFDPASSDAGRIAGLWWLMVVLGGIAFAVFAIGLVVALRRRRPSDGGLPAASARALRWWVVGGGVLLPSIVLTVVLVFTVDVMRATSEEAPDDALQVEIIGHQWWWEVRYPEYGVVTANEIHLPVGSVAELRMTSADVIHSLWVPALGGKRDLLPDYETTLVFRPDETGRHRTQCAEFCGVQHARMGLIVFVEPEPEFLRWVDANSAAALAPADSTEARGEEVFFDADCASCHAVRGTAAVATTGPDLTHVGSRETIGAATVPLTAELLRDWITDPHTIKQGVDMPATRLDDEQIDALIAYLLGRR